MIVVSTLSYQIVASTQIMNIPGNEHDQFSIRDNIVIIN